MQAETSNVAVKYTLSKELMHVRQQEKLMFQIREYDKAEELRLYGDEMEAKERVQIHERTIAARAIKEE